MLKKLGLVSAALALTAAASVGTASANHHCPPPQQYSGVCTQVIVWAKSPDGKLCCQYSTPCAAPDGWTIYYGENCTNTTIQL